MPNSLLITNIIGLPPPYDIYLCDPGPTNCVLVASSVTTPYTLYPIPSPFDDPGYQYVVSADTLDITYTGSCEPESEMITAPNPNCVVFLATELPNQVVIYNLPTNGKTYVYQLFTGQQVSGVFTDIAVDNTHIYILNNTNQIFKYTYTLSPFSANYVTSFTIAGGALDPCLEVYDNNSLITARGSDFLLISKTTGSVSTSVPKPSNRTVTDIMVSYAPSGTKIFSASNGNQTNDWAVAQQDYNTGTVEYNILTTQKVETLFQYGTQLFSNKSFLQSANDLDYFSNYFPYGPIQYYTGANVAGFVRGAAQIPTCNNFEFTNDPRPNVITQGCTNDAYAPPIILNGITVTFTSTGDVQYPGTFAPTPASCNGTLPNVFGNPLVGFSNQFTYTFIFSSPVNGAVLTIKGTGQVSGNGSSTTNEIFTITTNGGTPTISTITSCQTTIAGNVISSGALTPYSAGSGGRFIINAPGTYTTLTVSGPQNVWAGSILQICI